MGEIIQFPLDRIIKPTLLEKGDHWRLVDLQKQRPHGHPELKRDPRGRVCLEKEQVWVENGSSNLWVIAHIKRNRHTGGTYKDRVWLHPYKVPHGYLREISEQTLRGSMEVWEDAVVSRKKLADKLRFSPEWYAYFGLDKDGNRID